MFFIFNIRVFSIQKNSNALEIGAILSLKKTKKALKILKQDILYK